MLKKTRNIFFRLSNIIKQASSFKSPWKQCLAFIMVSPSKGDCPLLQGNLRNSTHYLSVYFVGREKGGKDEGAEYRVRDHLGHFPYFFPKLQSP